MTAGETTGVVSAASFREVLLRCAQGAVVFAADGEIVFANPAARALLEDLPPPAEWLKVLRAAGRQMLACQREEDPTAAVDAESFPIDWGDQSAVVVLLNDISARQALEAAHDRDTAKKGQAHKLEAIGQLAAGIAHEINTPTQYISDNTTFLQEAFGTVCLALKKYREILERIHGGERMKRAELEATVTAAKRLDLDFLLEEIPSSLSESRDGIERVTKIVTAMKEFSHPSSGRKRPTDLNRAIETTLTVCRNEWKYVADLETDFDPALPPVDCLPDELNQVWLNMMVNAAHAIEEAGEAGDRGTIKVSTKLVGEDVEVRLSDTGGGIPESIRKKVFDPFFTTKAVGKGTGQGLAIAYHVVVSKHHGRMEIESKLGAGTTFVVTMPLRAPLREMQSRLPAQSSTPPLSPGTGAD